MIIKTTATTNAIISGKPVIKNPLLYTDFPSVNKLHLAGTAPQFTVPQTLLNIIAQLSVYISSKELFRRKKQTGG
jgi:hypothetical protein